MYSAAEWKWESTRTAHERGAEAALDDGADGRAAGGGDRGALEEHGAGQLEAD